MDIKKLQKLMKKMPYGIYLQFSRQKIGKKKFTILKSDSFEYIVKIIYKNTDYLD